MFVLGYGVLWFVYGVIAKSSQDLNADMAEMVVWTREPALGYSKHPPLLAWILWVWFKVFPLADWAYILLAVVDRRGRHLSGDRARRRMAVAARSSPRCRSCSPSIPFYNFLGLKFDQNSILIPLWALAMWAMLRALDTRHDGWAALAGSAAAAAMLSKYWSVFLIAALSLAALLHAAARATISARARPWVTALVFLAAVAPHVWWLVRENFPPVTWVTWRRISPSFTETLQSLVECLAGTRGLCGRRDRCSCSSSPGRPRARSPMAFSRATNGATPRSCSGRRSCCPSVPALIKNIHLLSLWNTPGARTCCP